MFLAVDISNSSISLSIFTDNDWTNSFKYEITEEQPLIYYINGFNEILLEWGIFPSSIKEAGIASVVPQLNDLLIQTVQAVLGITPHVLSPEDFTKLNMFVPKTYEIGADIVANSYAAITNHQKDCLIVDFGTAVTFTVVKKDSGIQGVSIAPGLKTAMQSLSVNTVHLPEVWLKWPKTALGHNTQDAIRSGVLIGYYGLINELRTRILREYPSIGLVIATGSLVERIAEFDQLFDIINKQLTFEGIKSIVEFNAQSNSDNT